MIQGFVVDAADVGIKAPVVGADDAYLLLFADSYAAATQNTFGIVPHHMGRGGVKNHFRLLTLIQLFVFNAIFVAQRLQLAAARTHAG